jgi:hypothetical protein
MTTTQRLTHDEAFAFPTVLRTVVGSEVHGTGLPGLGDVDIMGLGVDRRDNVLGMFSSPETWQYRTAWSRNGDPGRESPSQAGDIDLTVYPVQKWAALAIAGNPSVLAPVFVDDEHVLAVSEFGQELRENRHRFISRALGTRSLGYAVSQRESLLGLRNNRTARPSLVEQFGFDTKFAGHMIRLGLQRLAVFEQRTLPIPLPVEQAEYVRSVRRGEIPLEAVLREAERLEAAMAQAAERTDLSAFGDVAWVNDWLAGADGCMGARYGVGAGHPELSAADF